MKWRMDGEWRTERFMPEGGEAAKIFEAAAEEAATGGRRGGRWPWPGSRW
ncbi:hypothetical protein ABZZ79_10355 [Streptomyces sp. NPDC006458]